jgi:hypothetical protein
MKRKDPSAAPSQSAKQPRAPTVNSRVKELKGSDGVNALKWAKDRASDHVVHTDMGNVRLFEKYPINNLSKLSDGELIDAVEFYTLARDQYLAFMSGSTGR